MRGSTIPRATVFRVRGAAVIRRVALSLGPDLAEIDRARVALAQIGDSHGIAARSLARLQIALDEVLSNVVHHAGGDYAVGIEVEGARLRIEVADRGPAFDPTRRSARAGPRPRLGGRGLDLVHGIADEIAYRREGAQNLLSVVTAFERSTEGRDMTAERTHGLAITEDRDGAAATLRLDGRIDSGNAGELTRHALALVDQGYTTLVIDMTRLDYLTSAGFRTFLVVSDAAEAKGGALRLRAMSADVRDLFEMSGLIGAFDIEGAAA